MSSEIQEIYNQFIHGPVVEEGYFSELKDEYENKVRSMDEVDVQVEKTHDTRSWIECLLPKNYNSKLTRSEEDLSGEEALEFVDRALENIYVNDLSLDELDPYLVMRSKEKHNHNWIQMRGEWTSLYIGIDFSITIHN